MEVILIELRRCATEDLYGCGMRLLMLAIGTWPPHNTRSSHSRQKDPRSARRLVNTSNTA